jgi:hypothetical protein
MRLHTAIHADDLYELISDPAGDGKPPIRTSNGAPRDGRNLFPNRVVAESLCRPGTMRTNHRCDQPTTRSPPASDHYPCALTLPPNTDVALVVDAFVVTAASHPRGPGPRHVICRPCAPSNHITRLHSKLPDTRLLIDDADELTFARRSAQYPAYCTTCR